MNQRTEFALRALGGENHSALCREYGISRKTGYKWVERYKIFGASGMGDESRRPQKHAHELPEAVVCEILKLKIAHKAWGPKKIRELYCRKHPHKSLPSLSSFKRVLEKAGLTQKRKRRVAKDCGRLTSDLEAKIPNDLWTVDFKGWWKGSDQQRVEPLTVRDQISCKILAADLLPNTRTESVKACFIRLFESYGLPQAIRSDNGPPFASSRALLGLSRLSVWWLGLGIELIRGRPGCPQDNGAHERMHRDIMVELQKEGIGHDQKAFDLWRDEYNSLRPHEKLQMKTPDEVYTASPRRYPPEPLLVSYPGMESRRVSSAGYICHHQQIYFLSRALSGHQVGLRYITEEELEVRFARQLLGHLDLSTRSFRGLRPQAPEAGQSKENVTP